MNTLGYTTKTPGILYEKNDSKQNAEDKRKTTNAIGF